MTVSPMYGRAPSPAMAPLKSPRHYQDLSFTPVTPIIEQSHYPEGEPEPNLIHDPRPEIDRRTLDGLRLHMLLMYTEEHAILWSDLERHFWAWEEKRLNAAVAVLEAEDVVEIENVASSNPYAPEDALLTLMLPEGQVAQPLPWPGHSHHHSPPKLHTPAVYPPNITRSVSVASYASLVPSRSGSASVSHSIINGGRKGSGDRPANGGTETPPSTSKVLSEMPSQEVTPLMLAVGASRSRTISQYGHNARLATGGPSPQLAQEIEDLDLDEVYGNHHAPAVLESLVPTTDYRPPPPRLANSPDEALHAVTPKVLTGTSNIAWSHTPPAVVMSEAAAFSGMATPTSKLQKAPRAAWGGYSSGPVYDYDQKDEARAQRARRTEALTSSVVTEEEWDALETGQTAGVPSFLLASRMMPPVSAEKRVVSAPLKPVPATSGGDWD